MRIRSVLAATILLAVAVPVAFASFGGGSGGGGSTPPATNPDMPQTSEAPPTTRQEAERLYGDAYNDVAKAKDDTQAGKAKNAEKKYRHALERARHATELDTTYVEAWNLIGFASRKLGDYPGSLAAYERCLALKPDYAPAREYLGEAYVELGKPRLAREQLVWLEKLSQEEQASALRAKIEAFEAAHPDSTASPARPDSINLGAGHASGH
jgi:tetratricopeptide (TPR) repeat protein